MRKTASTPMPDGPDLTYYVKPAGRNGAFPFHLRDALNSSPWRTAKEIRVTENDSPRFLYVTCQVGAEKVCKAELEREHPELRLAFSRPGFITFKVTGKFPDALVLKSTFARAYGWSLGRVSGETVEELAQAAKQMVDEAAISFDQLHVWQRDSAVPGVNGFEPFPTVLAETVGEALAGAWGLSVSNPPPVQVEPATESESESPADESAESPSQPRRRFNRVAKPNQIVLDVVLVEPNQWWLGWHVASTVPARWVGGVPPLERDDDVISRAYYKLSEALLWSQLPLRKNDLCIDLGSAPGGASQRLLEQGAKVFAIDPADMDPGLEEDPGLFHIKMRSKDVSKKDLAGARWLVADLNVAPNYTLDAVEELVTNQHIHLRGLILTLKLTQWELAEKLAECRERVKAWGFAIVKTRQLAFNRREVCLVAIRDRMDIRASKKPKPKRRRRSS